MSDIAKYRSALYGFAFGKVVSGFIGALWFAALARNTEPRVLGWYVAFVAFSELAAMLSSAGVYAFAQRYVPEMFQSLSKSEFRRVVAGSVLFRLVTLILVVAVGACASIAYPALKLADANIGLALLGVYFVLDGSVKYLEVVLESTLAQWLVQLVQIGKNTLRLGGLLWLSTQGEVSIESIIALEAAIAMAAFAAEVAALLYISKSLESVPTAQAPSFKRMSRFCAHMYLALAAGQLQSADSFRVQVAARLGAEVVAGYGVANWLAELIRRYSPLQMLQGIVRTALVSARTRPDKNSWETPRLLALFLKVHILVVAPVLVVVFISPGQVLQILTGGGRYESSSSILQVFMIHIALQGLRVSLALQATVLERASVVLAATICSLMSVPLAWVLVGYMGPMGAALSMILAEVIQIFALASLLRAFWLFDSSFLRGVGVIIVSACIPAIILVKGCEAGCDGLGWVVWGAMYLTGYVMLVSVLPTLSGLERAALRALFKPRSNLSV